MKGTIGVISDCIEKRILTVGAAGSISCAGSQTRFQIMQARNMGVFAKGSFLRCVRRWCLPRFYFFGERVGVLLFFYKITTNILHNAFIGCVS